MIRVFAHPLAHALGAPLTSLAVAAAVIAPGSGSPAGVDLAPADALAGIVRQAPRADFHLAAAPQPEAPGSEPASEPAPEPAPAPADDAERGPDGAGANLDEGAAHVHVPTPRPPAPAGGAGPAAGGVPTSDWLGGLGPIEPYARYEPQTTCSPTAKPGTAQVRDALLSAHPGTRNLGIIRACPVGGRSEHKEGRAFDWGAYVSRPHERAAVDRFITQLLATDADGNRHALARRMGVMYVIWNGRIWSRGSWRAYSGPSPHTDHLHLSLSWDGAMGRTSFFTLGLAARGVLGQVPEGDGAPTGGATPPSTPQPDQPSSEPAPRPAEQPAKQPAREPAEEVATDQVREPRPRREKKPRTEQPEPTRDDGSSSPAPSPTTEPEPTIEPTTPPARGEGTGNGRGNGGGNGSGKGGGNGAGKGGGKKGG